MRKRIAYFSPMPGEQAGISDHTCHLLESLMHLFDVDIFTSVPDLVRHNGWLMHPYSTYAMRARHSPYLLNVYAIGNHPKFRDSFDLALREPGLVIMHSLSLYDFYRIGFGKRHGLLADEVEYAHGAGIREKWQRYADYPERVDRVEINLLRRLAERSHALVTNTTWGQDRLQQITPGVPVYHIPYGVNTSSSELAVSNDARAALQIPDDAFVAGVFGLIAPVKRVVQVVEAFVDVVKSIQRARLLIAGRSPDFGYVELLRSTVRKASLERNVKFLDSPSLTELEGYMGACNVIVDLRWLTAGESSSIMARGIALGKPIITTDIPQFRELSERYCWRISHDERIEHSQLVSALLNAAENSELIADAQQATQEYARAQAEWGVVAGRYADIIADLTAQPKAPYATGVAAENPLLRVTGVNCIGDITADTGLGTAAHQMVQTIRRENIPASFIEHEFPSPTRDPRALTLVSGLPTSPIYPTNILFYNIHDLHLLSNEELTRMTAGKYLIARWFWELSQLSDEWIERFSRVDEVWVSSVFTQRCMQAITTKPIKVIPVTVEVPISSGAVRVNFRLPEDRFIFIFTFAATSTAARKNPFAVIQAYEQAFGHPEGKGSPVLVIKAHFVNDFPELKQQLIEDLNRVGGMLIAENLTRQQTNDLLDCADCYISLHRAEGFGLGPAEAMYLGKPVIATNYSGNVDFMTVENSYLVDYQERKIVAEDHQYNPFAQLVYQVGMTWAEPNIAHAAELMRRVYEDPEERSERGAHAASDIRAQYSHEAVGRLIRRRLAEIERDKPQPTKDLRSGET